MYLWNHDIILLLNSETGNWNPIHYEWAWGTVQTHLHNSAQLLQVHAQMMTHRKFVRNAFHTWKLQLCQVALITPQLFYYMYTYMYIPDNSAKLQAYVCMSIPNYVKPGMLGNYNMYRYAWTGHTQQRRQTLPTDSCIQVRQKHYITVWIHACNIGLDSKWCNLCGYFKTIYLNLTKYGARFKIKMSRLAHVSEW